MAGIPSYVSVASSQPRLRGDGMDSDAIDKSDAIGPSSPPPQRHRNLNSSRKAATVSRSQKPRHIPREPIKGAVGQLNGLPLETRTSPLQRLQTLAPQSKAKPVEHTQARIPAKLPDSFMEQQIAQTGLLMRNASANENHNDRTPPVSGRPIQGKHKTKTTSLIGGRSVPLIIGGSNNLRNVPNSVVPRNIGTNNALLNVDVNNIPPSGSNGNAVLNLDSRNILLNTGSNGVPLNQNKLQFTALPNPAGVTSPDPSADKGGDSVKFQIGDTVIDVDGSGRVATDTVAMVTPPKEERQVEGQSRPNEDLGKLQQEVKGLSDQLQQQVKVNTDLKKLLVASVGDDLQWKMDALIHLSASSYCGKFHELMFLSLVLIYRTKTQLGSDICDYTKKIENDYEELDKLSIQADMWRSKFMATRVLIDQLATDKEDLSSRLREAERGLEQLMSERQQLHENLVESHRYLKLLRDSFDPVLARKSESIVPNILELGRTNLLLSEAIKLKLLGSLPVLSVALDAGIQNGLTPGEKLAYKVLMDWSQPSGKHATTGRLPPQTLHHYGRFHPQVKYEGIACTHCRKCKGEIQVV